MRPRRLLSTLLPVITGCAILPTVPSAPKWYAEGPTCERTTEENERLFCATTLAGTEESARGAALALALSHAAAELSVETKSKLVADASCLSISEDNAVSSRCEESTRRTVESSTRSLVFRGAQVDKLKVAPEQEQFRAWIVVRIPPEEWARVARQAGDRTLVALDCRMGEEACPARIMDALTAALPSCGVQASGGIVTDVRTNAEAVKRAETAGAARTLYVSLQARSMESGDGLVSLEGGGRWEMIDVDGKTVTARGIPSKRAVDYSAAKAGEKALRLAVERLASPSCGLSEAAGSLCCAEGR